MCNIVNPICMYISIITRLYYSCFIFNKSSLCFCKTRYDINASRNISNYCSLIIGVSIADTWANDLIKNVIAILI